MYVYPRYRPSLGLLGIAAFSVFMFCDPVKDLLYVLLLFIQMTCFYMSIYVDYRTHEMKKGYYYLHLTLYQNTVKEIGLWENSGHPVVLALKRYELTFLMFESSMKNLYEPIYKKHVNKFEAIRGEIGLLTRKKDLAYSDLSDLRLSIKTLIS